MSDDGKSVKLFRYFFHILQESTIFALLIRETGHPTGFFTILDFIIRQFMQDLNESEAKSNAE